MQWLEVIHLRATEPALSRVMLGVEQLIKEADESGICVPIKLFKRMHLKTDICLHLSHDNEHVENTGSSIGLRIVSALKDFGMVNHTVWLMSQSKTVEK